MISRVLAEWAADSNDLLNEDASNATKRAFVDVVACAVAGSMDPSTRSIVRLCRGFGSGAALGLGVIERRPAPWAALIGGTAAHALDFDDNFAPATTHATAVLAPALFALADELRCDGQRIATAYIVGLEVQARIGRLLNPSHYEAGWHATSTVGTIGSAVACARLLGLDPGRTLAALSAAASMAAGSKKQFGTSLKPVHAGLAAKNAVLAARMAEAGIVGDVEPLTGKWGISELYDGEVDQEAASLFAVEALSSGLSIERDGLLQKRFPCCGAAHRTLDGLARLREAHGIRLEEVERIEAFIPSFARANLRYDDPQNETEARFSLTYCGARVLQNGTLDLADLTDARVRDPEIRRLYRRFAIHTKSGSVAEELGADASPALTRITMTDGRVLEAEISAVKGSNVDPLAEVDTRGKFTSCCEWAGAGDVADELYALSGRILEHDDHTIFSNELEHLLRENAGPFRG